MGTNTSAALGVDISSKGDFRMNRPDLSTMTDRQYSILLSIINEGQKTIDLNIINGFIQQQPPVEREEVLEVFSIFEL